VAACENQSILVLDCVSRKLVHSNRSAHSDCVNGVTFLDDRLFLSCSDDTTVALWDLRAMKGPLRRLKGHSSWVKNIEAMPSKGYVLTSGFDCKVICWDVNK
jgi:DDB1- and CUL4-associated factor 10